MNGTITVEVDSIIAWLIAGTIFLAGYLFMGYLGNKERLRLEAESEARKAAHAERERDQRRSTQKNVGGRVKNAINSLIEPHKDLGFYTEVFEENGSPGNGYYSVHVRRNDGNLHHQEILQVSINFLNPYGGDPDSDLAITGTVHYGKYGSQYYFMAADRLVMSSIQELVLDKITAEILRVREYKKAS